MAIIGVDRSGDFLIQDVSFAAVKFTGQQNHRVVCLNRVYQNEFKGLEHWREKLSAACIFLAVTHNNLYRQSDDIQIDKDFQGRTQAYVKERIQRLFGKSYSKNRLLSNPQIQFLPKQYSENIRDADRKSWRAYHKKLERDLVNPNLDNLLDQME